MQHFSHLPASRTLTPLELETNQLENHLPKINKKKVRLTQERNNSRKTTKKIKLPLMLMLPRRSMRKAQKVKLMPLKLRLKVMLRLPRKKIKKTRKPRMLKPIRRTKLIRKPSNLERNQLILQKRNPTKTELNKRKPMPKPIKLKQINKVHSKEKLTLMLEALLQLIITKLFPEVLSSVLNE